jgi:farnesyl-diphosphate farnesyltransferase
VDGLNRAMRRSQPHSRTLGREILAGVSRSFYLSLAILPQRLRAPLSLGYLLARATDTAADATGLPPETREHAILTMLRLLRQGHDAEPLRTIAQEIGAHADTPAERLLLERFGDCISWLETMDEWDRHDILWVLDRITRGQIQDVKRFGAAAPGELVALGSPETLREYTYLVAGCVGEFWTRLCFRHRRGFSRLTPEEMAEWGVQFGQGLQLVNILRDAPADLARGRCYIPLQPERFTRELTDEIRGAMQPWFDEADDCLAAAWRYVRSVLSPRIRFACAVPALLGARTLQLARRADWQQLEARVKVPRKEVRYLLLLILRALGSPQALNRLFARFGGKVN